MGLVVEVAAHEYEEGEAAHVDSEVEQVDQLLLRVHLGGVGSGPRGVGSGPRALGSGGTVLLRVQLQQGVGACRAVRVRAGVGLGIE